MEPVERKSQQASTTSKTLYTCYTNKENGMTVLELTTQPYGKGVCYFSEEYDGDLAWCGMAVYARAERFAADRGYTLDH